MNLEIKDLHILVAGGLGGIGTKTVELLLEEGAIVTVLTQSFDKPKKSKISHKKLNIISTDYKNKDRLYEDISNAHRKKSLSGFISLIGSGRSDKKIFLSEEESKRIWDINYFYPRLIAENFVQITNKDNHEDLKSELFITFCSSLAASCFLGAPTEYSTAKAALERLTKDLSWKLSPCFRVNCVAPGNIYFEGGTWDRIIKNGELDIDSLLSEKVPSKRLGKPIDVAAFIVFLSSNKLASFFNGSCVIIDGGQKTCI